MPPTRGFTASMQAVSDVADKALERPEGLSIPFTLERFGYPDGCRFAARSFQQTFTSIRARQRKLIAREGHGTLAIPAVSETTAPYDKLSCIREPKPDGSWIVSLVPNAQISFELIDRATGEVITDRITRRFKELVAKLSDHFPQFTQEDYDELTVEDLKSFGPNPKIGSWQERAQLKRGRETFPSASGVVSVDPLAMLPGESAAAYEAWTGRLSTPEDEGWGDITNS